MAKQRTELMRSKIAATLAALFLFLVFFVTGFIVQDEVGWRVIVAELAVLALMIVAFIWVVWSIDERR